MEFLYKLDKSSKKYICPSCGKKTFVRYIDMSGNLADEKFGRCDRQYNCAYICIPNDKAEGEASFKKNVIEKPISYIPYEDGKDTFKDYDKNALCLFLIEKLGYDKFIKALELYQFGIDQKTISNRDWVIFWQVDKYMNCRSGKMIKYLRDGHRDKSCHATWFHKVMRYEDFNLKQCFFGEHLLNTDPRKPIAIVESEKTAIIASQFIDNYIWIASGGREGLGFDKCKSLENRNVTLFPDLGAFDYWKGIAKDRGFSISDSLERRATDEQRKLGLDLADFLI